MNCPVCKDTAIAQSGTPGLVPPAYTIPHPIPSTSLHILLKSGTSTTRTAYPSRAIGSDRPSLSEAHAARGRACRKKGPDARSSC